VSRPVSGWDMTIRRAQFIRTLAGFLLLAPAGRLLAAELSAGDGSTRPADPAPRPGDLLRTLRARRATQIARVEAYRRRGAFPRNIDFAGERVPYFVDDRGVACAVAYLMIEDGRRSDVDAIAVANNHVRVMDVSDGPIAEWVTGSGLLQEEAARIQPSYDFMRPSPAPTPFPEEPGIVERRRIREHLGVVLAELRRDTESSLLVAVDRFERGRAGG
jgi:hypothetical protein